MSKLPELMKGKVLVLIFLFIAAPAFARPIYVYKEPDGAVRFTTIKPHAKFKARIYKGGKGSYSTYKSPHVRYSISPRKTYYRSAGRSKLYLTRYGDIINSAASRYSMNEDLIKAVIHVESSFNPQAVSPKGAKGLMQLIPYNLRKYGVRNPYSPQENIFAGTKMLSQLLNKYSGNLTLALAAYNAGEGAVKKYNGVPPYKETVNYVKRVLKYRKLYAHA